jgi:hypothetical protein
VTLLEDLQALDLSAIVNAKGSITLAIDAEGLRGLLTDGPAQTVMGELGSALAAVQEGIDNSAALLTPLVDALGELPGLLGLDDLPLADYLAAVREGAELMAAVVGGLEGDLGALAPTGGTSVADLLERAGGAMGEFAGQAVTALGRYRALIDTVEAGVPTDPGALADLALDVLLPFPKPVVGQVRGQLDSVLAGLTAIDLPTTATSGLVGLLTQVRVRAEAGDAAGVQAALGGLARLGDEAVAALADGLRRAAQALDGLRLDLTLGAMAQASAGLRAGERGVLEELADWRARIAEVRAVVEGIDPAVGMAAAARVLDLAEAEARRLWAAGVDAQLERMKAWLRGLLRELPLRQLRGQLSAAILGAAQAVTDADLDRVATDIRRAIADLGELLALPDLGELVGDATQEVEDAVRAALDQVETALSAITGAVNDVAGEARAVLERAVEGLAAFRSAVDEIRPLVDPEHVNQAAQQVIDALSDFREQAETLLTAAPVPDALRPVIEQVTATIEGIDLEEAIGQPLRAAAERLQLPDEVGTTVTAGLAAVADAVSSLVPTQLIADLRAELDGVLDTIGQLDVTPLTSGITQALDQAASFLEDLDVVGAVAPASSAFAQVLEAVDRVHPRRLLQPAIEAYDNLLGRIPIPDSGTLARRAAQVTAVAGEATAQVAAQPLQQAAPTGSSLAPGRGATPAAPTDAPVGGAAVPPSGMRPGDIVRLVGFLPAALREALAGLQAGPAGQALAGIHRMSAGLAADLRRLRAEVVAVGERVEGVLAAALGPVAAAQIDAQLALHARFGAGASGGGVGVSIDVDASVALIASVAPARLYSRLQPELDLLRARAGTATGSLTGSVAANLEAAADALDGSMVTTLAGDLDAFLAALDPEPIAAEFDALVASVVDATPGFVAAVSAELADVERRVRALIAEFNPGAQAQKLLGVFDVLREELDLLNPARLADELGEVHAALRAAIAAYDPAVLAADVDGLIDGVAADLRGLNPASLLPDLSGVRAQVQRLPNLLPVQALTDAGAELQEVGGQLVALDVQGLLDTVNALAPAVTDAFLRAIEAVKQELLTLLRSIRYASTSASASVSVGVSVG